MGRRPSGSTGRPSVSPRTNRRSRRTTRPSRPGWSGSAGGGREGLRPGGPRGRPSRRCGLRFRRAGRRQPEHAGPRGPASRLLQRDRRDRFRRDRSAAGSRARSRTPELSGGGDRPRLRGPGVAHDGARRSRGRSRPAPVLERKGRRARRRRLPHRFRQPHGAGPQSRRPASCPSNAFSTPRAAAWSSSAVGP
ncbi:MAG: hypothetical protein MZU79_05075 [Anaerotruncus sp.]|nr:hypothetical protein [Anaerotruncus sp.]